MLLAIYRDASFFPQPFCWFSQSSSILELKKNRNKGREPPRPFVCFWWSVAALLNCTPLAASSYVLAAMKFRYNVSLHFKMCVMMRTAWTFAYSLLFFSVGVNVIVLFDSPLFSLYGVGRQIWKQLAARRSWSYWVFVRVVEWVQNYGSIFETSCYFVGCCHWVDHFRCIVMGCDKCVFRIVWFSLMFQILLIISALPTVVFVPSTKNEVGVCWCCAICFDGGGTCLSSGDGGTQNWLQNFSKFWLRMPSVTVFGCALLGCVSVGWVVIVAVVNHDIHNGGSVSATTSRACIMQHLWSFAGEHE